MADTSQFWQKLSYSTLLGFCHHYDFRQLCRHNRIENQHRWTEFVNEYPNHEVVEYVKDWWKDLSPSNKITILREQNDKNREAANRLCLEIGLVDNYISILYDEASKGSR